MIQEMIPRYHECMDCGGKSELTEEEVFLMLPFIKIGEIAAPVDKTVKGYCRDCATKHLGKVEKTCSTMDVSAYN